MTVKRDILMWRFFFDKRDEVVDRVTVSDEVCELLHS